MTYPLTFDYDFYVHENDCNLTVSKGRKIIYPTSVFQALMALCNADWEAIAQNVFSCTGDELDIDIVINKIKQTNKCTSQSSPVEVWIDDEGVFRLNIFEEV